MGVYKRTTTTTKTLPVKRARVSVKYRKPISRKQRNYRNKAAIRKRLGTVKKRAGTQRNAVDSTDTAFLQDNNLYTTNCTAFTAWGGSSATRQRNEIHISGIQIQLSFLNKIDSPLWCNVAVVSPTNTSTTATATDFFRGSGTERAKSFSSTTAFDRHMLPINTDAFNVLMHKRFILAAVDGGGGNGSYPDPNRPGYRDMTKYIKIGRRFTFENDEDTTPTEPNVFLCMWFQQYQVAAGDPVAVITVCRRVRIFFRELDT